VSPVPTTNRRKSASRDLKVRQKSTNKSVASVALSDTSSFHRTRSIRKEQNQEYDRLSAKKPKSKAKRASREDDSYQVRAMPMLSSK